MELDDLIGHLDDLIELARAERFAVFANELAIVRCEIVRQARKGDGIAAPSLPKFQPPRCGSESPGGLRCAGPLLHLGSHAALDARGGLAMWDRGGSIPSITFPVAERVFYGP